MIRSETQLYSWNHWEIGSPFLLLWPQFTATAWNSQLKAHGGATVPMLQWKEQHTGSCSPFRSSLQFYISNFINWHMVWFYFQTFNPELPALDMSLMETPSGIENVRVRFLLWWRGWMWYWELNLVWCNSGVGMGLMAQGDTAGSSHPADSRLLIISVGMSEFRRDPEIISSPTSLVQSYTWNASLKTEGKVLKENWNAVHCSSEHGSMGFPQKTHRSSAETYFSWSAS